MRWSKIIFHNESDVGDSRVIKKFLILPKCLYSKFTGLEYRWLENARIYQVYNNERKWTDISWDETIDEVIDHKLGIKN